MNGVQAVGLRGQQRCLDDKLLSTQLMVVFAPETLGRVGAAAPASGNAGINQGDPARVLQVVLHQATLGDRNDRVVSRTVVEDQLRLGKEASPRGFGLVG